MHLGKQIRLHRIFSHPSKRLCSVAVDHFCGYQKGLPEGLVDVPKAIAQLVKGKPDAISMNKGMAKSSWEPFAGVIPLIMSSVIFTPDDNLMQALGRPEEAVRMGADAIAVAIGVRGKNEGGYLKILANAVEEADKWNLPVMAHIYPRDFSGEPRIVHDPENIMWAVRCGIECGADVIKVPYTGDPASYRDIIATCPVPLVAAGGPREETLYHALEQMTQIMAAGARGATIGRNIWGTHHPTKALQAFKAVIHDGKSAHDAAHEAALPHHH